MVNDNTKFSNSNNVPSVPITVPLGDSKVVISGSCPILVLTTVLGRPRRADFENGIKNYQGPTTSRENTIGKYGLQYKYPGTAVYTYVVWCVLYNTYTMYTPVLKVFH